MPPEAEYCPPDERFDVYGLATTLWEVGTGERVCGSPQAATPRDLPEDLREVLLAALIADPDDRRGAPDHPLAGVLARAAPYGRDVTS